MQSIILSEPFELRMCPNMFPKRQVKNTIKQRIGIFFINFSIKKNSLNQLFKQQFSIFHHNSKKD